MSEFTEMGTLEPFSIHKDPFNGDWLVVGGYGVSYSIIDSQYTLPQVQAWRDEERRKHDAYEARRDRETNRIANAEPVDESDPERYAPPPPPEPAPEPPRPARRRSWLRRRH